MPVGMSVKRAFDEDLSDCTASHKWDEEPARGVEIIVTLDGKEYPLCRSHAAQLREMLDEELGTPRPRREHRSAVPFDRIPPSDKLAVLVTNLVSVEANDDASAVMEEAARTIATFCSPVAFTHLRTRPVNSQVTPEGET